MLPVPICSPPAGKAWPVPEPKRQSKRHPARHDPARSGACHLDMLRCARSCSSNSISVAFVASGGNALPCTAAALLISFVCRIGSARLASPCRDACGSLLCAQGSSCCTSTASAAMAARPDSPALLLWCRRRSSAHHASASAMRANSSRAGGLSSSALPAAPRPARRVYAARSLTSLWLTGCAACFALRNLASSLGVPVGRDRALGTASASMLLTRACKHVFLCSLTLARAPHCRVP